MMRRQDWWTVTWRLLLALAMGFAVAWCKSAVAAEPEPVPDDVGLDAGDAAPFAGILVAPLKYRVFMRDGTDLDTVRANLVAEKAQREADNAAWAEKFRAIDALRVECERDKAPPPKKVEPTPWYDSRGAWAVYGGVIAAGLAALFVSVAN